MLVLSRFLLESIILGDDVWITVGDKTNLEQAELVIDAPRNISVFKKEDYVPGKEFCRSQDAEVIVRKKGESIIIADDVEIVIVDIRQSPQGLQVRLGINAPRSISVHRKEVYEAIMREKAEKAKQQPNQGQNSDSGEIG